MSKFWKNKKVVVTGSTGFIGSHTVDTLVEKGAEVTAVISPKATTEQVSIMLGQSINKISVKRGDLLQFNDCMDVTRGQDIVFNLAAMDGGSSFKSKYPAQIFKVNNEIVLHMLEAAIKNGVQRFLLMSSIEVYPHNAKIPIKEQFGLEENFREQANGYTWSKRFGEIAAKMYAQEYGLEVAIVRAGNVYGQGDVHGIEKGRVIPSFIHKVLNNEPINLFEGGKQKKQFIYIKDLITALLDIVEKYAQCDPVNIAGSQSIAISELLYIISELIEGKDNVNINSSNELTIDISKARKVINFSESVNLIEGLKRTIRFYRVTQR